MNGTDMGITYPVGGVPRHPGNLAVSSNNVSPASADLTWDDLSDNEEGFFIESSTNLVEWVVLKTVPADTTKVTITLKPAVEAGRVVQMA